MTKQCEKCDGTGEIVEKRQLEMEELTDLQIKVLTEADIYRLSDGQEKEDMPDVPSTGHGRPSPHMGGTPNI